MFLKKIQPLDRTAITLIVVLSILISLLIAGGGHTAPRVRDFSWQDKQVGAEDQAFILTFSRPMDQASVEQNLRIAPPLPGKVSWAGRRMAYTLDTPAPYGESFRLELQGAKDRFTTSDDPTRLMSLYAGEFRTRDRAFVYLGVTGEQEGRLVLENLSTQKEQILTPSNLVVMDFEPYPEGDRILFSASDRRSQQQGLLDQKLYTVTTGIQIQAPASSPFERRSSSDRPVTQAAGQITEILDSKDYQNLKFDLSPDGQTVIVQRVNRQNPGDFGLWMLTSDAAPQPLKTEPGGDFLIAPDSQSLAMTQGQGLALLPLSTDADALDFLPKYGQILSFASDGTAAAFVKFNVEDPKNPTRSLFVVTNQGTETEILETNGSIASAQFSPSKQVLYCLYSKLMPGEVYAEEPYIAAINLKTKEKIDLLRLPVQRDIQMNLAPDGLAILFDQVAATDSDEGVVRGSDGRAIANSQIWLLPLETAEDGKPIPLQPQTLPFAGLRPRWLP